MTWKMDSTVFRARESARALRPQLTFLLWLPGIGDLQHFHLFPALVSPVHVKRLGITVHNLPYRAVCHVPSARFIVPALQSDGLAVRARCPLHLKDPGAHSI